MATKLELMEKSLTELRAMAEELSTAYTKAVEQDSLERCVRIEDEINEIISAYTEVACKECYKELLACEDPMLEAVKRLTFTTIHQKDDLVEGTDIIVHVIEDVDKPIDLRALHKAAGKDGIGKDKNWIYAVEQLNCLMTARICEELGVDCKSIRDNYYMAKISREIDLGKNVTSNKSLLRALSSVIAMMIGEEYKPLTKDVNFLYMIYSKKGRKALAVSCANHGNFTSYIKEICHRIVTNGVYTAEYKTIKKQK